MTLPKLGLGGGCQEPVGKLPSCQLHRHKEGQMAKQTFIWDAAVETTVRMKTFYFFVNAFQEQCGQGWPASGPSTCDMDSSYCLCLRTVTAQSESRSAPNILPFVISSSGRSFMCRVLPSSIGVTISVRWLSSPSLSPWPCV